MVFEVTRGGDISEKVTITYRTEIGTALAGPDGDFPRVTNVPLTFRPGVARKVVAISTRPDTLDEGDETFKLTLIGRPPGDWQGVGTIIDDDNPADLNSFPIPESVAVYEGDTVSLAVTRTGNTSRNATVGFRTLAGTAEPHWDYRAGPGLADF